MKKEQLLSRLKWAVPVWAALCLVEIVAQDTPAKPGGASLEAKVRHFEADLRDLQHVYLIEASEQGRAQYRRLLSKWQDRLERMQFSRLSPEQRVDWLLLRDKIAGLLAEAEDSWRRDQAARGYMPGYFAIAELEQQRRLKQWIEPRHAAHILSGLTEEVKAAQKRLEGQQESVPTALLRRALRRMETARGWLEEWYRFRGGYDPIFTWWVEADYEKLARAIDGYIQCVRKKIGLDCSDEPPLLGEPVGRDRIVDELRREWIAYSPEELIQIGEHEYRWCEEQLKAASQELGCGDDWKKALERVEEDHLPPEKHVDWIRFLADEATRFVEERRLVSVPKLCKEGWRIEMMPPERQKVNPYFTGGRTISVSYPTASMDVLEKEMTMLGNNRHFTRATVLHEVIPGHWLQAFMAERYRPYRQYFETPFYVEGWALYWEMRFWDLGFPQSPQNKIGMLFWRAHRCARIIFSLKYHLGQMSAEEAVQFLIDKVGHKPKNARAEVRRSIEGGYPPLYQIAYMVGALQLRALHAELVGSGKKGEREFHDTILKEGPIPIELIRRRILGLELTPNLVPSWRFYHIGESQPAR